MASIIHPLCHRIDQSRCVFLIHILHSLSNNNNNSVQFAFCLLLLQSTKVSHLIIRSCCTLASRAVLADFTITVRCDTFFPCSMLRLGPFIHSFDASLSSILSWSQAVRRSLGVILIPLFFFIFPTFLLDFWDNALAKNEIFKHAKRTKKSPGL